MPMGCGKSGFFYYILRGVLNWGFFWLGFEKYCIFCVWLENLIFFLFVLILRISFRIFDFFMQKLYGVVFIFFRKRFGAIFWNFVWKNDVLFASSKISIFNIWIKFSNVY